MLNSSELNNEKKIEDELFNSLKFYGYLFPENSQQVDMFEQLHDNDRLETPSLEDILSGSKDISTDLIDLETRIAAYSNTDDSSLDLPEEESDETDEQ